MSDLAEQLKTIRERIDAALRDFSEFGADCPSGLSDAIQYSLLAPGKRLRPTLVLGAAEACGIEWEPAIPAACAVEMIHAYSLIHDDLPAMDDDELRRGMPTCHIKFGEANAILAGDALIPRAFEIVANHSPNSAIAVGCIAALSKAAGATALVGGQYDDLDAEFKPGTVEQLKRIHRRKTGALITASVELGGIVAEASAEQLTALKQYGQNLGLAFQITDDLLDIEGDPSKLGKNTNQDELEGKLTYPKLLGVEESQRQSQELIEQALDVITVFGERAAHLQSIAKYLLTRNH